VSLHGKKGLGKKDKKRWHCDKILVHHKEFGPIGHVSLDDADAIMDVQAMDIPLEKMSNSIPKCQD
jgi:hypothetical protein